jgi:hypothetical protein
VICLLETDPAPPAATAPPPAAAPAPAAAGGPAEIKEKFLEEVRKTKKFFYGTVVAQAQSIVLEPDRIVFTFAPQHRHLRAQLDQSRGSLEELAAQIAGRRMAIVSAESGGGAPAAKAAGAAEQVPVKTDRRDELKQQALADSGVQAMLDVFAAEIKDVEEM